MKNILFSRYLFLVLLIGNSINAYPQYFFAGQHNASNYFVDINPDLTLIGPNNSYADTIPAATFQIDINGDGINDFSFYSSGWWVNGWGDSEISIKVSDTNTCQIAYGYTDTCQTPNSTYFLYKIAKSLSKNDSINNNLDWVSSKLFLTYTNWAFMVFNCAHNGFVSDSLGNYIGVRMLRTNDTLYGWIKITNINFLTFTLQEFACSKNSIGIREHKDFTNIYPIPTNNSVIVETQLSDCDLVIYSQYGIEIMKKKLFIGKNVIDLSRNEHGVYIFKILKDNFLAIKKIIKQ